MKNTILIGVVLLAAAGSAFHPFGAPKAQDSALPLVEGAALTPDTQRILDRACVNCHSERTRWPWYGYVAPASWLLERDVAKARQHMNLSRWNAYPVARRRELLAQMGVMTRGHLMPPPRYLLLHKEAKLSAAEIDVLYQWERAERVRLHGPVR